MKCSSLAAEDSFSKQLLIDLTTNKRIDTKSWKAFDVSSIPDHSFLAIFNSTQLIPLPAEPWCCSAAFQLPTWISLRDIQSLFELCFNFRKFHQKLQNSLQSHLGWGASKLQFLFVETRLSQTWTRSDFWPKFSALISGTHFALVYLFRSWNHTNTTQQQFSIILLLIATFPTLFIFSPDSAWRLSHLSSLFWAFSFFAFRTLSNS